MEMANAALSVASAAEPSGCSNLDSVATVSAVDIETQIQPIFNDQCIFCHQPGSSGDLDLTAAFYFIRSTVMIPADPFSAWAH